MRTRVFIVCSCLFATSVLGQATLTITNYGAVGDVIRFYSTTVGGSAKVTTTNVVTSADIGKVIEVFGVRLGTWAFITNNQDTLAIVTNVVGGNEKWLTILFNSLVTALKMFRSTSYSDQLAKEVKAKAGQP